MIPAREIPYLWVQTSGKLPVDLGPPPLDIEILLVASPRTKNLDFGGFDSRQILAFDPGAWIRDYGWRISLSYDLGLKTDLRWLCLENQDLAKRRNRQNLETDLSVVGNAFSGVVSRLVLDVTAGCFVARIGLSHGWFFCSMAGS